MTDALNVLLRFCALLLRSGDTAFRVHQAVRLLAPRLGLDRVELHVASNGVTATGWQSGAAVTLSMELPPPGIDAARIGTLAALARETGALTPQELAARLDTIETVRPLHALATVSIAIGLASGAFAYLNGGGPLAIAAAAGCGAVGQTIRALLFRHGFNQYAVTALTALLASGLYCLVVIGLAGQGFTAGLAVGFISSALFLVPGFPLVAAQLDLVQHQTAAGVARLVYALALLLAGAFGLSVAAAAAGLTAFGVPGAAGQGIETAALGGRALASFAGGCGFALLYNSPLRTVLLVGLLSLAGNELRLALHDLGMALPPATFLGALAVGLLASLAGARLGQPRITFTVPSIIIMTPGIYAFRTIVLLNQGEILPALEAAVVCGFVIGGMALGLAAARFLTDRQWIFER